MVNTAYIDRMVDRWSTQHNLKKIKYRNEWKILCPMHGDQQQSLFINRENGKWYCFGCARGNKNFMNLVKEMAEKFGEPVDYAEAQAWGIYVPEHETRRRVEVITCQLSWLGKEYLTSRGFTAEQISKIDRNLVLKQMKVDGRWFLRFDVFDFAHKMKGWVRRSMDGEKAWLNKTGFDSERYLYGEWLIRPEESRVVIVEGAMDYLKVWLAGYPVLAVLNFRKASLKVARLVGHSKNASLVFFLDQDVPVDGEKMGEWVNSCRMFNVGCEIVKIKTKEEDDPGNLSIPQIQGYLGERWGRTYR